MYDTDRHSVRSGNMFTLTLTTPAPEKEGKEPGDYNGLTNKPSINGVELVGNLMLEDIGIPNLSDVPKEPITNEELDDLLNL